MEKGLLIMLIVFIAVGLLHFFSLKVIHLPEKTKSKFRKIFIYIYGLYFLTYGVYLIYTKGIDLFGIGFTLLAIVYIIGNYFNVFKEK